MHLQTFIHTLSGDIYPVVAPADLSVAEFQADIRRRFVPATRIPLGGWQVVPLRTASAAFTISSGRTLAAAGVRNGDHFSLVRECHAAAIRDPREDRLRTERLELEELNRKSETVDVAPINVLPGTEPEEYQLTFKCRGIYRIDANQAPVYGYVHHALMNCGEGFPSTAPIVYWQSDIWHPNIDHVGKGVCTNAKEWVPAMRLLDTCRMLFEMVQYKAYHAINADPWPLDREVAQWVRDYAEPNGIVDKSRGIWVDNRPFEKPTSVSTLKETTQGQATRLSEKKEPRLRVSETTTSQPAKSSKPRIRMAGN